MSWRELDYSRGLDQGLGHRKRTSSSQLWTKEQGGLDCGNRVIQVRPVQSGDIQRFHANRNRLVVKAKIMGNTPAYDLNEHSRPPMALLLPLQLEHPEFWGATGVRQGAIRHCNDPAALSCGQQSGDCLCRSMVAGATPLYEGGSTPASHIRWPPAPPVAGRAGTVRIIIIIVLCFCFSDRNRSRFVVARDVDQSVRVSAHDVGKSSLGCP